MGGRGLIPRASAHAGMKHPSGLRNRQCLSRLLCEGDRWPCSGRVANGQIKMTQGLKGLDEAQAAERLLRFGPNRLEGFKGRSLRDILVGTFREPMFVLLIGASGLYLILGNSAEGVFLSVAALATVALVVAQEARSERALKALQSLAAPSVRVIRGGESRTIPMHELVPGDLVLVSEGLRVPADCQLVDGEILSVDEAALTGESVPVTKLPEAVVCDGEWTEAQTKRHGLFAGTLIVSGQGLAEVKSTGGNTALGRIGQFLATVDTSPTPLQQASGRLVTLLGSVAVGVCGLVVLAYGLIRGNWIEGALAGITIAISLIPEEFPMVLAIFMALGAWRLAQHKVLVRRPAVIEALGGASMLCVDKTGTLTENRMTLVRLWSEGMATEPDHARQSPSFKALLDGAILASAPHPTDPMDRAVKAWATEAAGLGRLERVWPLTPGRLAVVQRWTLADGQVRTAAKGAPEAIFHLCQMDPAQRLALGQQVDAMAREGLRVLAVASGPTGPLIFNEPEEVQFDLLGLVGFLDPVRKDVPAALVEARQAGIAVAMITGDYPETALAIAKQAGIDSRAGVMTGAQLKALDPKALQRAVQTIRIFARIAPEQKLTLVEAFKAQGFVVAMTGDGVNDAPALQAAHIGIAMGLRGTDVAREAASLVLLDDSFPSIIGGVRLGRRIFANLRKALTYVVAIHVPIAGLALLPIIIGMPPLLYPMHIVLMEMVIDPICALVFEGEPSDRDAMRHGPRVATDTLFGGQQLVLALCQGGVILLAVLGVYWISLDQDGASQARATAFAALIAANLILALTTAASSGVGLFDVHRLTFWGISLGAVAALALSFTVPAIASLFHFDAPSLAGLGLALVAGGIAGSVFAIIRRLHRLLGGREKMA